MARDDDPIARFSRRAVLAGMAGGAAWTVLLARLYQLQVVERDKYAAIADDNRVKMALRPPLRGDIVDRFGRPIATHRLAGRVTLVREQVDGVEPTLNRLSELIDLPEARRTRIIAQANDRPEYVPTLVAEELSYEDFARLSVMRDSLPGVEVEMAPLRSYPRGRDLYHVVGYVQRATNERILQEVWQDVADSQLDENDAQRARERGIVSRWLRPRSDEAYFAWYGQLSETDRMLVDRLQDKEPLAQAWLEQWRPDRRDAFRDSLTGEDRDFIAAFSDVYRSTRTLLLNPDMRVGREGLERSAERWLRGERGYQRQIVNNVGRVLEELPSDDIAPKAGNTVELTIDADLQRAAIERFGEESGAAVVLDIQNGEILAMVSTPASDPNDWVNGMSTAGFQALLNDERNPLYHKAYDGTYPPGSTYKMVTATAALMAGVITPDERIYCGGSYRLGNRSWACWKKGGHGSVNMHEAIKGSCDTYFYEVARRTGVQKLADVSRQFGFGHVWSLGIPGGDSGVVPDPEWKLRAKNEPWQEGETLNYGIGQGFLHTSPLQLAVMTARIASNGQRVIPRLIRAGPMPTSSVLADAPLDPELMERMKAGMFGVTSEGGGTALRSGDLGLDGIRMAGKTGTAQVRDISAAERRSGVIANEDLPRHLRDHALFVGYAPADAPRYAVAVVVEHGGGGSRAAAPVARDILREAILRRSGDPAETQATRAAGLGSADGGGAR